MFSDRVHACQPVLHVHVKEAVVRVAIGVEDDVQVNVADSDPLNKLVLRRVVGEVSTSSIEGMVRVDQFELEVKAKALQVELFVPIDGGPEHDRLREDRQQVGDAPVPLHLSLYGSPDLTKFTQRFGHRSISYDDRLNVAQEL